MRDIKIIDPSHQRHSFFKKDDQQIAQNVVLPPKSDTNEKKKGSDTFGGKKQFRPNQEMEVLVGLTMRASFFKLIKPEIRCNVPAGREVLFEWEIEPRSTLVMVELFNRDGDILRSFGPFDSTTFRLQTSEFTKGRYYWKILADENLIKAGALVIH